MKTLLLPILMFAETLIAAYLFSSFYAKKKMFWLSFLGYAVAFVVVTLWIEVLYMLITEKDFIYGAAAVTAVDSLFNFFFYCLIFAMTVIVCHASFEQTLMQTLFCCSGAYATQHLARNVVDLVCLVPAFSDDTYGELLSALVTVAVFAAVYVAVYFIIVRPRKDNMSFYGNDKRKLIISLSVIIICIGMSRLTNDNANRDMLSHVAESIYAILCCFLVLFVQLDLSENDKIKHEVASITELLHQERRQYELSKETIDLINVKCHDLKHQIAALRKNVSEESISEIEHAVMIYDSSVKTGNDVLDVILTEKKLLCESKKIQMTCSVKGEQIAFMDTTDIYSLFGNALSNAIESEEKVADEQKRCIGINVISRGSMMFIHVENYFEGQLTYKNDLPVTDKSPEYHGFGMMSMERIAKKYGGEMSVSVSDGKFNLDIILPIAD